MRLIDADDVKTWIKAICDNEECRQEAEAEKDCQYCRVDFVVKVLDSRPTVDAEPAMRGHWETKETVLGKKYTVCSACDTACVIRAEDGEMLNLDMTGAKYCPFCGAKMDGESNDDRD